MLNVIILAGNAVADPVVRTTGSGKKIVTVRLAVNNPLNDEEVLYIDVDTWEKQADFMEKYVKKGNSLSVVGRLKSRAFVGNDGVKRNAYSVVCERVNFIGTKKKQEDVPFEDDAPINDAEFAATAAKAMANIRASSSAAKTSATTEEF